MTHDEQLLATLVDVWRQAVEKRTSCRRSDRAWWDGVIAGTAVAIAATSGIPERIDVAEAITAGCEIARARL